MVIMLLILVSTRNPSVTFSIGKFAVQCYIATSWYPYEESVDEEEMEEVGGGG